MLFVISSAEHGCQVSVHCMVSHSYLTVLSPKDVHRLEKGEEVVGRSYEPACIETFPLLCT
jgi:hypothetical protein